MTENSVVTIPGCVLEQFHCCLCEDYLSSSPVRALPDGTCICGRCSLLNDDTPVYRVLALEAILCRIAFPCRFKRHGCKESVKFDKAIEHESGCTYRFFACPLLPQTTCTWKGTSSQILEHFSRHHANLVKQRAEFKVQIDQDSMCCLLVVINGVVCIVKYEYKASEGNLRYNVRHCQTEIMNSVCYNVRLVNDSDVECSISLKLSKCSHFDDDFFDMQNAIIMNLNKFLQCLENPNTVMVGLNLQIRSSCSTSTPSSTRSVNYDLLNSLRCHKCHEYLTLPLFDLEDRIICGDCAKTNPASTPSTDAQIAALMAEANYPCRWHDCHFVGKSANIKKHELSCQFRYYNCLFKGCPATFKLSTAVAHFRCHKTLYLPDKITYRTTFLESYTFRHIFTIKESTIVSVEYSVVALEHGLVHRVSLHSSSQDQISATLDFEHKHCKLKSRVFVLESGKELDISIDELPRCFKADEQLHVTVDM